MPVLHGHLSSVASRLDNSNLCTVDSDNIKVQSIYSGHALSVCQDLNSEDSDTPCFLHTNSATLQQLFPP
jgi:hypothetical protein